MDNPVERDVNPLVIVSDLQVCCAVLSLISHVYFKKRSIKKIRFV